METLARSNQLTQSRKVNSVTTRQRDRSSRIGIDLGCCTSRSALAKNLALRLFDNAEPETVPMIDLSLSVRARYPLFYTVRIGGRGDCRDKEPKSGFVNSGVQ